ncbi:MAG TPA: hypothetical protein PLU22_26745, partial [Polyangiaceae bacterium]|nr:hypothetical protein [Polyangiaceae bacterium]
IECPEADPESVRRREVRRAIEQEAAQERARDVAGPEILLVGIEDLDLAEVVEGLARPPSEPPGGPRRPGA